MDPKLRRLRERAERALGQGPVRDAVHRVRAIIGPDTFRDVDFVETDLVELAEAALEALRNPNPASSEDPTAREFQALQVLIQLTRPAVPTENGAFGQLPRHGRGSPESEERWRVLGEKLAPYLYSIGRIDGPRGERNYGTGFLVAADRLMTNKHVLEQISAGTQQLDAGQVQVNFYQEWGLADGGDPVPVLGVGRVHPELDVVTLIVPRQESPELLFADSELEVGDHVATIGYPYEDPVNSPALMDRIFESRWGVKQVAPGEIVDRKGPRWYHDCSTTGGNSGSPLVEFASGRVVAVHSAGLFMWSNEAVDGRLAKTLLA